MASTLKNKEFLGEAEFTEARLAQIEAGDRMLKHFKKENDIDFIISNAHEFNHIPSMLIVANHYFDQFNNPKGMTTVKRVDKATGKKVKEVIKFERKIGEDHRLPLLKKREEWIIRICNVLKEDLKIYQGDNIVQMQNKLAEFETILIQAQNLNIAVKYRIDMNQKAFDYLTYAWCSAYQSKNKNVCNLIIQLAGSFDEINPSIFLKLYETAKEKKCGESLHLLFYFKRVALNFYAIKRAELEKLECQFNLKMALVRKELDENSEVTNEIQATDPNDIEDELDYLINTKQHVMILERAGKFIFENALKDNEMQDPSNYYISQAIKSFYQAAQFGCEKSFDALVRMVRIPHSNQSLALEQFYELSTGMPEENFLEDEISFKAIDELLNIVNTVPALKDKALVLVLRLCRNKEIKLKFKLHSQMRFNEYDKKRLKRLK